MRCRDMEEWLELVLADESADEALVHAAEGPACGRLLDEVREMVGALEELYVESPPPHVLARATKLMPRGSWLGRVTREIAAALTADSALLEPVAVRGPQVAGLAEPGARRYLRF